MTVTLCSTDSCVVAALVARHPTSSSNLFASIRIVGKEEICHEKYKQSVWSNRLKIETLLELLRKKVTIGV